MSAGEDQLRYVYGLDGKTKWTYPAGEVWDCLDGKWIHDTKEEVKQKKHAALVDATRGMVTTRKLTASEVAVVFEATDHWPRGSFSCSGTDCGDVIYCNAEGQRTADLIAQLSFWKPTEDELPLSLMQSFVKGMRCGPATKHAYEIINQRIVVYLQQRYPQ